MTLTELQNDWNSPRNTLPSEQQRVLVEKFSRQMTRRRRFQSFWLIHSFIWLTLITGLMVTMIATGKTNAVREWAMLPLLLVPWTFAFYMLKRHREPAASGTDGDAPVSASLSAALRSNQTEQSHSRRIGILYIVMLPLLGLALHQLQAAGKVSPRELTSMAVFFGATILICGALVALRYFGRLRPQERQLKSVLQQFSQGAGQ